MGQSLKHHLADGVDALREFAGELFVGGAQSQVSARIDNIRHRLGLSEIGATIEKGASGEFARFGKARAALQYSIKHHFRREQTTVAGNFDNMFTRESP